MVTGWSGDSQLERIDILVDQSSRSMRDKVAQAKLVRIELGVAANDPKEVVVGLNACNDIGMLGSEERLEGKD